MTRRRTTTGRQVLKIGSLNFDVAARQLNSGDGVIELPRRELAIFECLILAGGRRITKTALLDYVYGVGADVEESVIEVYVSRLRTRLKSHQVAINTQRGLGYQLQDHE